MKIVSRSRQNSVSAAIWNRFLHQDTFGIRLFGHLQQHWEYYTVSNIFSTLLGIVRMWILTEINFAIHIYGRELWIAVHLLYLIIFVFLLKYLLFCNLFITLNWNGRQRFHNNFILSDTGIPSTTDILSNRYSVSLTTWQKTIGSTSKTNIV